MSSGWPISIQRAQRLPDFVPVPGSMVAISAPAATVCPVFPEQTASADGR